MYLKKIKVTLIPILGSSKMLGKSLVLYDPVNSVLGIYPKKMKTLVQKHICASKFIAALVTVAKLWKQTSVL